MASVLPRSIIAVFLSILLTIPPTSSPFLVLNSSYITLPSASFNFCNIFCLAFCIAILVNSGLIFTPIKSSSSASGSRFSASEMAISTSGSFTSSTTFLNSNNSTSPSSSLKCTSSSVYLPSERNSLSAARSTASSIALTIISFFTPLSLLTESNIRVSSVTTILLLPPKNLIPSLL